MDSLKGLCFLTTMFGMSLALSFDELPSCNPKFDCSQFPGGSYSDVHGDYVPMMLATAIFRQNQSSTDCRLNFTEILQECYPHPPAALRHMALGMKCYERRRLVLDKANLMDYENVLLQIQVHNCKLDLDDVDWLGSVVDLRVLLAFDTEFLPSTLAGNANHSYSGLKKIVTLSVSNSNSTNRLETFFPRPDVFKSMAEVSFHNMSIDRLPADFPSRMPKLQSLDLLKNNLRSPPKFPWYEGNLSLPLNLSRSKVFNTRYSTLLGITLDASLFRRVFHLGNNKIVTLRGYKFTGRIQTLTLPGNQLQQFGEEVLAQVTGLEQLDLSQNNLTYVSPKSFNHPGLGNLKGINLSGNQLELVDNATFQTLTNLTKINLANNKLSVIEKGTFSMLLNLEELHLENNQLVAINQGCFPSHTTALKKVILSNNMFTQVPAEVLALGSVQLIDLSWCQISLNCLNETLSMVPDSKLQSTEPRLRTLTPKGASKFKRTKPYSKTINLKNNAITTIPVYRNLPQFKLLLVNYQIYLDNNPIACLGPMNDFIMYLNEELEKENFDGTEYLYKDIKCASPPEFVNKPVISLDPSALFYPTNHSRCPSQCLCYRFVSREEYMVNCSYSGLVSFPADLPPRTVDLRLQHNNISTLQTRDIVPQLRHLDISFNQLSQIDEDFFLKLPVLEYIKLNHNLLGSIPKSLKSLRFQRLDIGENHLQCDCTMTWVKSWLFDNKLHITNWNKLTCTYGSNKQSAIVKVNDKDFVCLDGNDWKLTLAIAVGVFLLIALTLTLILYRFRFDIKALLFVRYNIKLFEKKVILAPDLPLETFILCSQADNHWTKENIYKPLKASEMIGSVALCRDDFLVGLTMEENFDLMVDNSSKIIVVLSESFFVDPLCASSLEKAVRISLRKRTKSIVIIEIKQYLSPIVKSACVRRFIRTQKKLKHTDKLFREKLLYSVARKHGDNKNKMEDTKTDHWETQLYSKVPSTDRPFLNDFYLACSDSDMMWVTNNIINRADEKGLKICLPARDFIPGVAIDTQIVESLHTSRHVLLILSNNSVDNFKSFVLRMAAQISSSEHRNYLIVIVLQGTVIESLSLEELSYLNTHAYLREEDALWWDKLFRLATSDSQYKNESGVNGQHVGLDQVTVDMKDLTTLHHCPGV